MTIKERIANYKKKFYDMTDRQQNMRLATAACFGIIFYAILCCMWNGFLIFIPIALVFALAYAIISAVRNF